MRAKITKQLVARLAGGNREIFIWDTETTGFGAKLTTAGSIVYIVQSRLSGLLRRYTIGRHGAPWTPDMARREAIIILGKVANGSAPANARQELLKSMTVKQLCDLYVAEGCGLKKPSTLATDRGRIERHIKRLLGNHRIGQVTRAHVERFLLDVASGATAADSRSNASLKSRRRGRVIVKGGKGTATRTVGLLGAIFQFAVNRSFVTVNPVRGVKRFPDRKCERFLSLQELSALGVALAAAEEAGNEDHFAVAAIRFLLLTGCRRGEALELVWHWIDFESRVIRYPDSKTGAKVVPLGAAALHLLSSIPAIEGNPHVFASARGKGSVPRLQGAWEDIRARAGLDDVRLHDLRHSFASVGAACGDSLLIIGKLLGHRDAASTQRYAHLSDDPLRRASERISGRIAAALDGARGGTVVQLKQESN